MVLIDRAGTTKQFRREKEWATSSLDVLIDNRAISEREGINKQPRVYEAFVSCVALD